MWSGIVWYVKSGNPHIYMGFGNPQWFVAHTAPAGTYRHVTSGRIFAYPPNGYAVRTNGGISHTVIFVQGLKNIEDEIPKSYELKQNYPNPFNPSTTIRFSIPVNQNGFATLKIYNSLGQKISQPVNEHISGGAYEVMWDASEYPAGVYFYELKFTPASGNGNIYSETKKMILVK
jgi:hypothetical protein